MSETQNRRLSPERQQALLDLLHGRFEQHKLRHADIVWPEVHARLHSKPEKLWTLEQMEVSGGEPDVVGKDVGTGEIVFADCSAESPAGRRNLCYDRKALDARKTAKPAGSALEMAEEMGAAILTEEEYRKLQSLGEFDLKTSSWILTPEGVRKLGGALFGDRRYGRVFFYHNGAESYYGVRGFRASVRV